MIPSIITDTSITFIAKGRPWVLAYDHPKFGTIKELLQSGTADADHLTQLADVRVAVDVATDGAAVLTEDGLFLNGEKLSEAWEQKAHAAPDAMKVLIVNPGDRVRVTGDPDAPDGIYTVGDVDNADADKRVYVESDEDYFGFVANTSIVEIIRDEADAA
ncbi:hypothetical protein [Bradyrhizobium sp. SZCCHNRI2010]|uniref:hypothetical protein n=1 Tax=Bradyrhizobium sp. SZCCHNRI2010 TaxID=3057283 RepID=UPI0028EED1E5|nr:hypothetical protein [Bradyrhizobium sp. SZCCHNRI2010]